MTEEEQRLMEQGANPGSPEGAPGHAMLTRMNREHAPLRAFAFSHMKLADKERILDVGCGGGATIAELLALAPRSEIDGIDYMEASVEETGRLNRDELGRRLTVQRGDVQHLPYADGTFDLVTAVETVYFWPDVTAALAGIRRTLKPGGELAVICEGCDPDNNQWPKIPGTFRIYRPGELVQYMFEAGFDEVHFYHGEAQMILVLGVKNK